MPHFQKTQISAWYSWLCSKVWLVFFTHQCATTHCNQKLIILLQYLIIHTYVYILYNTALFLCIAYSDTYIWISLLIYLIPYHSCIWMIMYSYVFLLMCFWNNSWSIYTQSAKNQFIAVNLVNLYLFTPTSTHVVLIVYVFDMTMTASFIENFVNRIGWNTLCSVWSKS